MIGSDTNPIVDHHVGLMDQSQCPECQKIRITWSRADQIDFSGIGNPPALQFLLQGTVCLRLATVQHLLGNRSGQDRLPEAAAQSAFGKFLPRHTPESLDQSRQSPERARNAAFQMVSQQPPEYRRSTVGANCDLNRVPPDYRRQQHISRIGPYERH